MDRPKDIVYDPVFQEQIKPILEIAKRGQHVLTRRDILKFVTSEAGTRAKEIQELLNITDIENIRKTFVTVKNTLEKKIETESRVVEQAKNAVNITANLKSYDEKDVLSFINENRLLLNGNAIVDLDYNKIKLGLKPPMIITPQLELNPNLILKNIENIKELLSEPSKIKLKETDIQLRSLITTIHLEPNLLDVISRYDIIKSGLELIDETGNCPLCDTDWPEGELKKYLEKKIKTTEEAIKYKKEIDELSKYIITNIDRISISLERLINTSEIIKLENNKKRLQSWLLSLQKLSEALTSPIDGYPLAEFNVEIVQELLAPTDYEKDFIQIMSKAKELSPEITPGQNAWDTLSYLEENLKFLENSQKNLSEAAIPSKRAETLLSVFLNSRDRILSELYERVRDRFVELYRDLHSIDEQKFSAIIEPDKAGLDFKVDFHGRGINPPHALHSEGHQDSMGLCLFLALSSELTQGLIDFIILDDVVMSVDANHRRQICQILGTIYPNRQFLITTHDKTWANQLRRTGVASSKESIEFFNWDINTGPQTSQQIDLWNKINEDMAREEVSSAAAKLRRGSEDYFGMVCDSLHSKITYNSVHQWELGDFLPGAMAEYNELIKQAKRAANSWNNKEQLENLKELDSIKNQIYSRINIEQWALNANVHYNNWVNFTPNDFQPVVEAFQDLWSLFTCGNCGGMLYVAQKGKTKTSVRCNCTHYNWNLMEKE